MKTLWKSKPITKAYLTGIVVDWVAYMRATDCMWFKEQVPMLLRVLAMYHPNSAFMGRDLYI